MNKRILGAFTALSMLVVGLIFLAVVGLGELAKYLSHRKRPRG